MREISGARNNPIALSSFYPLLVKPKPVSVSENPIPRGEKSGRADDHLDVPSPQTAALATAREFAPRESMECHLPGSFHPTDSRVTEVHRATPKSTGAEIPLNLPRLRTIKCLES